jgi:hypothetical protein
MAYADNVKIEIAPLGNCNARCRCRHRLKGRVDDVWCLRQLRIGFPSAAPRPVDCFDVDDRQTEFLAASVKVEPAARSSSILSRRLEISLLARASASSVLIWVAICSRFFFAGLDLVDLQQGRTNRPFTG